MPLLDPYLGEEHEEKQADVDHVPADEGEAVGREPVEGGAIKDGSQRIQADDNSQGRDANDAPA